MTRKLLSMLALAPMLLAGCEDVSGPEDGAQVRIAFATSPVAARAATLSLSGEAADRVITGSNGTLTLSDVVLIVAEFELEGPEACVETDDEGEAELEECEFEAPPFLLDLPLDGGPAVVATGEVPAGTYTQLEFEVEDLDLDEDDEQRTRDAIGSLRTQIRAAFPGFPDEASAVVRGTFTPTDGPARPFVVFLDADIEAEIELVPPLVITGGEASRTLVVQLDPALWFTSAGRVVDLSAWNGRLIEFEDEFEAGVRGVERDD